MGDANNNCGCDWDGGDCCGKQNKYTHCINCQCKDQKYIKSKPSCSGSCEVHAWKGDGMCDDGNNKCACDWDGGDCCKLNKPKAKKHCSLCQCLDPKAKSSAKKKKPKGCWVKKFQKDGHCDDLNNFKVCQWDGGDCCGVKNDYRYCSDCRCLDPRYKQKNGQKKCNGKCAETAWVGDKFCDADNNNCGCNWDDGDCCDIGTSLLHCSKKKGGDDKCKCLNPDGQRKDRKCKSYCKIIGFVNDGNCDDPNNTCGCNWDGGDCCGPKPKYLYCANCKCQNPADKKYYGGSEGKVPSKTRPSL